MLKIIFPCIALIGLFLLIRSVLRLSGTFTSSQQEFPAGTLQNTLTLNTPGRYEIDIKRPSITGVISLSTRFDLTAIATGQHIQIIPSNNIFAGRKNARGERIVPVAHFIITQPGNYLLKHLSPNDFKVDDRLIIMPAVGLKGAWAILATVFASLLSVGGLVCTMLAFKGKI